jgi:hypothetical protein
MKKDIENNKERLDKGEVEATMAYLVNKVSMEHIEDVFMESLDDVTKAMVTHVNN